MYWKRRNIIALALVLAASLSLSIGLMLPAPASPLPEQTHPPIYNTSAATEATLWEDSTTGVTGTLTPTTSGTEPGSEPTSGTADPVETSRTRRFWSALLVLAGVLAGGWAVFLLTQQEPLLGPDAIAIAAGFGAAVAGSLLSSFAGHFLLSLLVLLSLRELWGWLRSRFTLDWCLCHRTGRLFGRGYLPVLTLWIALYACLLTWLLLRLRGGIPVMLGTAAAAALCLSCLIRFSRDLAHLEGQLKRLADGQPPEVRSGTFAREEEALCLLQQTHQEAIRTAVTSERFKVDLIANVSHDLRTPLTAILGYGELLEKEPLSPEGRAQLERLNRKAGYMEALVESLFELTKVSSGVLRPKPAPIDLIRLLEQTIGLYDDALTGAGLAVRRHYCADSVPVVTDGARLHQVFANLLGNAIKYALAGSRIHLEVRQEPEIIRVRLVNTACYEMDFDPDEIMQRFARGDKARSTQGSGLGLAIAQTYTESLDGHFRVSVDGDQFSAIVELPKTDRNL